VKLSNAFGLKSPYITIPKDFTIWFGMNIICLSDMVLMWTSETNNRFKLPSEKPLWLYDGIYGTVERSVNKYILKIAQVEAHIKPCTMTDNWIQFNLRTLVD